MSASDNPVPNVPQPILDIAAALNERGRGAWLVGEPLHDLLVAAPHDDGPSLPHYALATSASAREISACFERAVQVDPQAACLRLPTRAGSLDLLPLRNGSEIDADLAHRDFTLLSMAYSPRDNRWVDPHGGLIDLKRRELRAVRNAAERLAEDPICALRASRLAARHGYTLDPDFIEATRRLPPSLVTSLPATSVQAELRGIFASDRAGLGLAILRASGVESALIRGVRSQAAALVDRVPKDLALRLTAWLAGAGGARLLARLRFDRPLIERFLRLAQYHPLDRSLAGRRRSSLCKVTTRLGEADVEALLALREQELDVLDEQLDAMQRERREQPHDERKRRAELVAARARLASVREQIGLAAEGMQQRRTAPKLVITGAEVMQALGSPPGPRVGAALRHLRDVVREAPERNHASGLREALCRWAERNP